MRLLNPELDNVKNVIIENVKATFVKLANGITEVVLEINSNKFLLNISFAMDRLEKMELIAVKGFVDVSLSFLMTLRNLVYKLYFEC